MRIFVLLLLATISISTSAHSLCGAVNLGVYKDFFGADTNTGYLSKCLLRHPLCVVTQEKKIRGYTIANADPMHDDVLMAFYNDAKNGACLVSYWGGGTEPEDSVDVWQYKDNQMTINQKLSGYMITDSLTAKNAGDFLASYITRTRHKMSELGKSCIKDCGFGKDGIYIGFFAGVKMGGSYDHPDIAASLKKMTKGNKGVFCVKGPDPLSTTNRKAEAYWMKHPVPAIVKCRKSAAVYVGPYETEKTATKAGGSMQFMLWHTYFGSILQCKDNKCVLSFPN